MIRSEIKEQAQLDAALKAEGFLLFKHSHRCSISTHAFQEYCLFVEAHPEVAHGWIDVVAHPDWARAVAALVDVGHQSPQALWMNQGHVLWHASHFEITANSLAANVDGANA